MNGTLFTAPKKVTRPTQTGLYCCGKFEMNVETCGGKKVGAFFEVHVKSILIKDYFMIKFKFELPC